MADEVWLPSGITSNWVVNTCLCWYVLLCTFQQIACMSIYSQHTLQSHVLDMVQPRVVHINSVSNVVENITFMHCPPERRIKVPVPVQVATSVPCTTVALPSMC